MLYGEKFRYGPGWISAARGCRPRCPAASSVPGRVVSQKQDLERQIDALTAAGIPAERIYLDKKSGATTDRPGLRTVLEYARAGDVMW